MSKRTKRKDKAMSLQGSTRSEKTGTMPVKVSVVVALWWFDLKIARSDIFSLRLMYVASLLFSCT